MIQDTDCVQVSRKEGNLGDFHSKRDELLRNLLDYVDFIA